MAKKNKPISATYFGDYSSRKAVGQDYETNNQCTEYIDWYMSAWQAKEDRGLFDLLKTFEEYWEGHANIAQYEDDPATNTNVIHPMIEGQVALMADDNWEVYPEPQTPSEIEYVPMVKRMLEFVLENNDMFLKNELTARRILKYGMGIQAVQYNPDWGDGFGLPEIRTCNPAYIYPDPNIVDVYAIQEGRFIIETTTKSIAWAERTFGKEKASMITPGYDPITESTFYSENDYNNSEIQRMHYLHMHIWQKDDKGKLHLIQMSACGVLLDETDKFCSNEFPYFFIPCYVREGTIWAKGDAELLMDQQDQINDIDDQVINNARLTGNPQKVFDPSLVPDGEMWTNEPGLLIPATGGPSAVSYLPPAQMANYPIERRNRIMDTDISAITRFYAQMAGGRIKGVDTATEALALQQSGMTGIDHKKKIFATIAGNMIEYIYKMCVYYWDDEKYFVITGEKDFMRFNPANMNEIPMVEPASYAFGKEFMQKNPDKEMPKLKYKEDKNGKPKTQKARFKFNFKIGSGVPKNPAFMYSVWKEDYATGVASLEEFRNWQKNYLGMPFDLEKPEGTTIDMAQMQAQTQNMTGVNTSLPGQPQMQQGNRVDRQMSATPNVAVNGLNANDAVRTAGGI